MELEIDCLTSRKFLQKVSSYKCQFYTKICVTFKTGLSSSSDGCVKYKEKVTGSNQNRETPCNMKLKFTEPKNLLIKRLQTNYNISRKLLRPRQFLEKLMKILEDPFCRNKSGPFSLLNVAVYWQSSDTEACIKKLSQILANIIDNGGRGIGHRIYMTYCLKK